MPLSAEQQCFFVAILAFIVVGFQRGWRRELVSLVFTLLAVFLIHPETSKSFGEFLGRLPGLFGYLTNQPTNVDSSQPANFFGGYIGSLIIFSFIVALGYYIGNKVFPRPITAQERFIGIVPAIIAGSFILNYLNNYFPKNAAGQPSITLNLEKVDPSNYIPIIFVIAIVAILIAWIAARAKKASAKK
ncbi:hypothetical protein [Tengunoibacter tsumagoiensis]|uniref:Uncharacterized protein n=1 Tax=Tengunoibacter tsumagoiensis TaxID=2014871 RepID=A0A402A4M6_9CHLR|nr:hypothetical protein [Tengunoibacter tsumagoiensis]GCE14107.1 hypothetical protein KTT_39660 [Tengunoibacter tsumagoiensis]